jgi:hypothetical protein
MSEMRFCGVCWDQLTHKGKCPNCWGLSMKPVKKRKFERKEGRQILVGCTRLESEITRKGEAGSIPVPSAHRPVVELW